MLPESGEGEAHNIVVAAFDARDADHAYPLLDAVGAGLVEGTVGVDIMGDFVVGKVAEEDVGLLSEGMEIARVEGAEADAGVDGVAAT